MKLPEDFKVEVKDQAFFDWIGSLYNLDFNLYVGGDTLYVTQEIYDRLKETVQ